MPNTDGGSEGASADIARSAADDKTASAMNSKDAPAGSAAPAAGGAWRKNLFDASAVAKDVKAMEHKSPDLNAGSALSSANNTPAKP